MALSSTKNNIFKKVKDYVQKQDGLYPVSRDTSSDTVFMGNSNASNVNTLTTVIGDGNYTSGDNGEMAEGLYSDSLIPKITDNESFTSAMPKLTRIVNNVRYLVHALGTSDITQIGDGTLTGAISTLNSKIVVGDKIKLPSITIAGNSSDAIYYTIDNSYTQNGYVAVGILGVDTRTAGLFARTFEISKLNTVRLVLDNQNTSSIKQSPFVRILYIKG